MLHLLDGFVLEGCVDAFSCIIDGPLGLVCGVSEVTESEGWQRHRVNGIIFTPRVLVASLLHL